MKFYYTMTSEGQHPNVRGNGGDSIFGRTIIMNAGRQIGFSSLEEAIVAVDLGRLEEWAKDDGTSVGVTFFSVNEDGLKVEDTYYFGGE